MAPYSSRRYKADIDMLLQKYGRLRIREENNSKKDPKSGETKPPQIFLKEVNNPDTGKLGGNKSDVDYGLALAAADYVAQILSKDEPKEKEEREGIIRQTLLQNMAHDFHLKGREEEFCFGRIRVIIRKGKEKEIKKPKEKKIVKSSSSTFNNSSTVALKQQSKSIRTEQIVTKKTVKTVKSFVVKKEVIKMPTITTTRVVRVK